MSVHSSEALEYFLHSTSETRRIFVDAEFVAAEFVSTEVCPTVTLSVAKEGSKRRELAHMRYVAALATTDGTVEHNAVSIQPCLHGLFASINTA